MKGNDKYDLKDLNDQKDGERNGRFSSLGLIRGPGESEEAFSARVARIAQAGKPTHLHALSEEEWKGAHAITQELFHFSADWILAFYEKKGLPFWQGAATWIEETPTIQLKPAFKKGGYLFNLYRREEVLAHEAVHAARIAFSEPIFEEHFAYMTAKSRWRRWFGPLFRSARESTFFLLLFGASLFFQFLTGSVYFLICPWALLGAGVVRLAFTHHTLNKCKERLSALTPHPLALMLRLSDKEIFLFARTTPQQIKDYLQRRR